MTVMTTTASTGPAKRLRAGDVLSGSGRECFCLFYSFNFFNVMAIFNSFTFGSISKKLGNVVAFRSRGSDVLRSNPLHIKNPRTDKQLTQRAKVALLVDLSCRFAPAATLGFPGRQRNQTAYNAFVSANVEHVTVDENFKATMSFPDLVCSSGALSVPLVTAVLSEEQTDVKVSVVAEDNSGVSSMKDEVYVVFYETGRGDCKVLSAGTRGKGGEVSFKLPSLWVSSKLQVYAFVLSERGNRASRTLYVTLS